MVRKGIAVWLFSSLTFISLIHLIEAISTVVFGGEIRLLALYPILGEKLQNVTPTAYCWTTLSMTLIFWGITCAVAFESPVEQFLNKILSDAKEQNTVETQLVEDKGEVLDSICEKVESTDENAAYIADMMRNVRTEVKEIKPLAESVEKIKMELHYLCDEVNTLKENSKFPAVCLTCGKPLMPDFKICPYCGETTRNLTQVAISVESYK